jgi:acetoin:2,6-dichlorophenolindophenol oxidoreductase subunit alpha
VSDVVAPYGFERHTLDGGDATAVWDAFEAVLSTVRGGAGPVLLECLTHRRRGHYEGDAEAYRDPVAEEEWRRRDPIPRLTERAIGEGWLDEPAAEDMSSRAGAAVEAAVQFARGSPFPDPRLAEGLVYAP